MDEMDPPPLSFGRWVRLFLDAGAKHGMPEGTAHELRCMARSFVRRELPYLAPELRMDRICRLKERMMNHVGWNPLGHAHRCDPWVEPMGAVFAQCIECCDPFAL
jgi:hypothetical protein